MTITTVKVNSTSLQENLTQLKIFLTTAPTHWEPHESIRRFSLPHGDYISCVLHHNLFHITGTDIVKSLIFRFLVYGRPVHNHKKFEEGVFSDLRNLKPGVDATLEEPRSEFLEILYKNNCIRTQKKQKVFYWYSVPHDRLFVDALERDLKREALGIQPTTVSGMSGILRPPHGLGTSQVMGEMIKEEEKQKQELMLKQTMGGHMGHAPHVRGLGAPSMMSATALPSPRPSPSQQPVTEIPSVPAQSSSAHCTPRLGPHHVHQHCHPASDLGALYQRGRAGHYPASQPQQQQDHQHHHVVPQGHAPSQTSLQRDPHARESHSHSQAMITMETTSAREADGSARGKDAATTVEGSLIPSTMQQQEVGSGTQTVPILAAATAAASMTSSSVSTATPFPGTHDKTLGAHHYYYYYADGPPHPPKPPGTPSSTPSTPAFHHAAHPADPSASPPIMMLPTTNHNIDAGSATQEVALASIPGTPPPPAPPATNPAHRHYQLAHYSNDANIYDNNYSDTNKNYQYHHQQAVPSLPAPGSPALSASSSRRSSPSAVLSAAEEMRQAVLTKPTSSPFKYAAVKRSHLRGMRWNQNHATQVDNNPPCTASGSPAVAADSSMTELAMPAVNNKMDGSSNIFDDPTSKADIWSRPETANSPALKSSNPSKAYHHHAGSVNAKKGHRASSVDSDCKPSLVVPLCGSPKAFPDLPPSVYPFRLHQNNNPVTTATPQCTPPPPEINSTHHSPAIPLIPPALENHLPTTSNSSPAISAVASLPVPTATQT